jgi:hypothetical protein
MAMIRAIFLFSTLFTSEFHPPPTPMDVTGQPSCAPWHNTSASLCPPRLHKHPSSTHSNPKDRGRIFLQNIGIYL